METMSAAMDRDPGGCRRRAAWHECATHHDMAFRAHRRSREITSCAVVARGRASWVSTNRGLLMNEPRKPVHPRGFAAMDPERQREVSSAGGRAAHQGGRAHRFSTEEARAAGRKGGSSVSQDRQHMSDIARRRTTKAPPDPSAS